MKLRTWLKGFAAIVSCFVWFPVILINPIAGFSIMLIHFIVGEIYCHYLRMKDELKKNKGKEIGK